MFVLRFAAYILAFASFIILIVDGAQSIAAGELMMTPLAALLEISVDMGAEVLTISSGGDRLPGLIDHAIAAFLVQPAALLVLALSVGLIMFDAVMNLSLARFARSLKRL